MNITYDNNKHLRNIDERDLSFNLVADIDWQSAIIKEDLRHDYGETRYIVQGLINDRLYVAAFTPTYDGIRVISFRKANKREVIKYEKI